MHRLSAESAHLVLDALPQLAWLARPDGFIFWYNRQWHEYTGRTPAEMEGWGWQSVHDPSALPEVLAAWRGSIASNEPFEMQFPLRGADGQYRMFLTRAHPVRDAAGTVTYWVGTNTDVSRQQQLEDALRASEATFRATFENAAVGIAHVDVDGRFLEVNATLCRITGYTADELRRMTFADITHPEDITADLENSARLASGATSTYAMEKRYRRRDDSYVWVNLTVSGVRTSEGQLLHFIAVVEDISLRKAAELDLRRAQQDLRGHAARLERAVAERTAQLEDMVRELGNFSYSVAHDLRAPLRTIRGFTEVLQNDFAANLPDEAKSYFNRIARAADRMDAMITDVLEYSRVSRSEMKLEDIDAGAVVREVVETLGPRQPRGGQVRIHGTLPRVRASRSALQQCLSNLVSNALKFSRPGVPPEVVVRAETEPGRAKIWVEDNGIGIQPEYQERIWGMFERLNPSYEGTGVGLSIVRRAADRMGGRVGVESTPGHGSRFWIELPVALDGIVPAP